MVLANKADAALKEYGTVAQMQRRYTPGIAPLIEDVARRDVLIGNEAIPTCTVMVAAYGRPAVSVIIEGNLAAFGDAMGATYNGEQLAQIAGDILSAYHYLTLADIILALKMGREGKFRDAQGNNIAKTYGVLSAAVVADIMYRYCRDVRNVELDRRQQAKNKIAVDYTALLRRRAEERRQEDGKKTEKE